jgi:hypothetical protein
MRVKVGYVITGYMVVAGDTEEDAIKKVEALLAEDDEKLRPYPCHQQESDVTFTEVVTK